jgi:nitrogen fixation/metabolism regulation signal transduction histidine kinase
LLIQDNGIGFDKKKINQAFEPYVSTKPKGKGLGLAIVKNIIEEHQGSIKIQNNTSGASIHIVLPETVLTKESL